MPLNIVQVGEPVLRQRARTLTRGQIQSREIQRLIESMREAMYKAPGVGLAAPQVGESLQLSVIEDKPDYLKDTPPEILREREREPVPFHVIINPEIHLLEEPDMRFFEGCLSLKGFVAVVPRARRVRVDCLNHRGEPRVIEASGWYARILQHEIDHLQGTLYIDRMYSRTLMSNENFSQHWKDMPTSEAYKVLVEDGN